MTTLLTLGSDAVLSFGAALVCIGSVALDLFTLGGVTASGASCSSIGSTVFGGGGGETFCVVRVSIGSTVFGCGGETFCVVRVWEVCVQLSSGGVSGAGEVGLFSIFAQFVKMSANVFNA